MTTKHLMFLLVLFVAVGCTGEAGYKPVDFSERATYYPSVRDQEKMPTLRVAVAAMTSPKETVVFYRELLDYLARKTNHEITLIQRRTYGEINELFPKGEIDLAFICTGPYAAGREVFGFEPLATPVIRGEPRYRSYLIVHMDSGFKDLSDLKGRVFAFTDPDSNTGALVPKDWLAALGETPGSFFSELIYTYSHDNSILAVAKGLVDGAAVDGHLWEYYHQKNPFFTSMTRVIKKSSPFGSPPLVASAYLPTQLKNRIREIALNMHQDPEGRRILAELMIDRLVVPEEVWYAPVKELYRRVGPPPVAKNEAQES
ncbi:MAG: phosphate/phosphite/phosphonate ABC transporter substrate-binding protein [Desulfobacterales bacterium]|nr:phosphate/phosphite/phosphonate ABC transporter substrate-binding protein [Desulfobacterales bacterium]